MQLTAFDFRKYLWASLYMKTKLVISPINWVFEDFNCFNNVENRRKQNEYLHPFNLSQSKDTLG